MYSVTYHRQPHNVAHTIQHSLQHYIGKYRATLVTLAMPSRCTYLLPPGWNSFKSTLFSIGIVHYKGLKCTMWTSDVKQCQLGNSAYPQCYPTAFSVEISLIAWRTEF